MKFYEIEIESKSPMIITRRRTEKNFISFTDYIPASTSRGALLSSLHWHGLLTSEQLRDEATSPKLIASPAYPIVVGEKTTTNFYPSHPLIVECKLCQTKNKQDVFNYLSDTTLKKVLEGKVSEVFRTECGNGHVAALKPLHPGVVGKLDGKLTKHHMAAGINVAVGISKHRGSSMKGMLYGYEALAAGQRLWSTVATPNDIKLPSRMRIWMGRGKSRGFGESELTTIKEIKLEERVDEVAALIKRGTIALYAVSPLLQCEDARYTPYPAEIDLDTLAKRAGLQESGTRLSIVQVLGKTSSYFWGGWDMVKNESRPMLKTISEPGSIVAAVVKLKYTNLREAARVLSTLEYLGTVENAAGSPITGVNMLALLETHPIAKLGG